MASLMHPIGMRPHILITSGGNNGNKCSICSGISPRFRLQPLYQKAPRASPGDSVEITTFRFTLGNEELDKNVPRIVGILGAIGLLVNHVTAASVSDAQLRTEILGGILSATCMFLPAVEERLRDMDPRRGRRDAAESIEGAAQVFKLSPSASDVLRNELAWASFTLIRFTNASAVVVADQGETLMCRGSLGAKDVQGVRESQMLENVSKAMQGIAARATQTDQVLSCEDRGDIDRAGFGASSLVPRGMRSLLLVPVGETGQMLLMSEQERAFSQKERRWIESVAEKLGANLS